MRYSKERFRASIGWGILAIVCAIVFILLSLKGLIAMHAADWIELLCIIILVMVVGYMIAYRAFVIPDDRKPLGYAAQVGAITSIIVGGFIALYQIVFATGLAFQECLATHPLPHCLYDGLINLAGFAIFTLVFYLLLLLPIACIGALYGMLLYKVMCVRSAA